MLEILFDLDAVTLERHGKLVLDAVSCSIPAGASCVLGPSGAGKSTLLRVLDRLAEPDSGSVRYLGRDLHDYNVLNLRREVCLVPQLPALLDGDVARNVSYGAELAGRRANVSRALELAGLDESFAARSTKKLSVGEQQRVMLARALALEPAVLLLDEPTSALDHSARDAVEAALSGLRDEGVVSYVLVTHDPDQAQRMADWSLRLKIGGQIDSADPLPAETTL